MAVGASFLNAHEVVFIDTDEKRLEMVAKGLTPIQDKPIEEALKAKHYQTRKPEDGYADCDLAVICVPTDFSEEKGEFDLTQVDVAVASINASNKNIGICIKSTCPIGSTRKIAMRYPNHAFFYVPEFLRESRALEDCLHPSRIVIGCSDGKNSGDVYALFASAAQNKPEVMVCSYEEAESIKLFSNTYLAMRVAFFNELDTYATEKGFDPQTIIHGVSLDPRIGDYYNHPSFGYGGYCLPKDSKQLLSSFGDIPEDLIQAVMRSNKTRKSVIVNRVLEEAKRRGGDIKVGIDRLVMKEGSTSFRQSPALDIISALNQSGVRLFLFEPLLNGDSFMGTSLLRNESDLKGCDVILHTLKGEIEIL